MTDIKKNILTKKSTMSDAIRVLQECELKIICIVENNKLVGTITDGDIRRALLKNLTLDCDCNKIMNTNFKKIPSKEKLNANKWDSLNHLRLISEIEKNFSITFGFDDIGKMRTLNKIILNIKKIKNYES